MSDGRESWDPPIPLGHAPTQLPTFPVDVLPAWAGDFVRALAEATQTPPDLAGMLVLSVLAVAAGGRAVVQPRPGWREPLNLFTVTALAPGTRKTPVFTRVTAPLLAAEKAMVEAARPAIAEASARQKAAKAAAEKAQNDAAHAKQAAHEEAIRFAANALLLVEDAVVPAMPRLLADDATPQALTSLLADQGGRIAVLSDEGDIFSTMAGRWSRNGMPDLAIYLKGHAGSTLRVDRKGRDAEFVESPALTLGLAVQPAVLDTVARIPGAAGLGLLARFLWCLPASTVGRRKVGAAPVPNDVANRYDTEVTTLVRSLPKRTDLAVIPFGDDADDLLMLFEEEIEPRLCACGDLAHVCEWASKLAGHTARIAGLLHLANDVRTAWDQPIQESTMDAAITMARFLVEHALAVFDRLGGDPVVTAARDLVPWLVGRETFTRREAHQAHRGQFTKVSDLDPVLHLLDAHGFVAQLPRPEPTAEGGRPRSPTYRVNPWVVG